MPDPEKQWYELVKHNFVQFDRSTDKILATVLGLGYAERMSDVLTERLSPQEKAAGFAVYWRQGKKPAGLKKTPKRPVRRSRR